MAVVRRQRERVVPNHENGSGASRRSSRIEIRVTPEVREEFEAAAALTGQTLTGFVVQSARNAAAEATREHQILSLTARDRALVAELLLNPPEPAEPLARALRERRSRLAGGDG